MRPNLSILIVSWNVWPLLRACLASIEQATYADSAQPEQVRRFGPGVAARPAPASSAQVAPPQEPATLEVIVVDNGSQDETCTELPAAFPWVRLIAAGENLGFTRGNNLAYHHAQGDYIYFLNPDTELIPGPNGEDSLWTLYSHIAADASIVLVGPRLYYGDGAIQNNRRRFPTRWTGFWESTWLGRLWPHNPTARRYHMENWPDTFAHDVDWLVGAAMLARRAALEAVRLPGVRGPFDETFFMYSEEVDLCRRLKSRLPAPESRIVFVPQAQVRHHEGRSSDQVVAARIIRFNRSKVTYYHKYFGVRWADLLRRYLLLEYRLMLWEERLKWLLGHKRQLRAQRIAHYRQVLADGLHSLQGKPHAGID